ncbi:MAG: PAS domain-containing protein [Gammaproteobacteria bacterium]|nr:PAS domain-containing protein [Gammaproteobacteria bacterium]
MLKKEGLILNIDTQKNIIRFKNEINNIKKDVSFLSKTLPIKDLIVASKNIMHSSSNKPHVEKAENAFIKISSEFIMSNPYYYLISFIPEDYLNNKSTRVKKIAGGNVVSGNELHDYTDSDLSFFKEALANHEGSLNLSKIDVRNIIDYSDHKDRPIIQSATPIFLDSHGRASGLIVISMDLSGLFDTFKSTNTNYHGLVYIANDTSEFISLPDITDKTYSNLTERFPDLDINDAHNLAIDESLITTNNESNQSIINIQHVHYNDLNEDYFIAIIEEVSLSALNAEIRGIISSSIILSFVLIVSSVLCAWYFSRLLTKPLLLINESISHFSNENDHKIVLPESNDEIGNLSRNLAIMMGQIRSREISIKLTEERFSLAIRGTNDGIWDWSISSNKLFLSDRWKEMLGYEPDEINNTFLSWRNLVHPDDLGIFLVNWVEYMEGSAQQFYLEYRLKQKNGSYAWILCRGISSYNNQGIITRLSGSHTDITQQKEQSTKLKEISSRLKYLIDNTNSIIYTFIPEKEYEFTFISENISRLLGYSVIEVLDDEQFWTKRIHPNDKHKISHAIDKLRHQEKVEIEYRVKHLNDSYIWLNDVLHILRGENKSPEVLGTLTDITKSKILEQQLIADRKQQDILISRFNTTQAELKRSEESLRYSQIFANVSTWDLHVDKGELYCSERMSPMLKINTSSPSNAYNEFLSVIHSDDKDYVTKSISNCITNKKDMDIEHRIIWPDNSIRWLHERGNVICDDTGKVIRLLGLTQDITDRKTFELELSLTISKLQFTNSRLDEAQSQLLQSEKMASIGQLAAGVAHEINNPVGYINSNLGSLRNYLADLFKLIDAYDESDINILNSTNAEKINTIKNEIDIDYLKQDLTDLLIESEEGVNRVKQIVQDLKDFSHVDEAEWQWADIHKGINSTLNIVHNEIKYKADVIKDYSDLPNIECIISQINQVFMNLLVNAAHAIVERGTITIRTGVKDNGIYVDISDTGKGIDKDKLSKIFDPFYTTKPVGQGTGLGLSLSYSIIQKHNGKITVESNPGEGTCFHIWLPIEQADKKAET